MKKKKLGRKSKRTPELDRRIYAILRGGLTVKGMCEIAGIAQRTFYSWCEADPAFFAETQRAIGQSKIFLVEKLRRSKDWRAAAFLLERRWPEEYGRVTERPIPLDPVATPLPELRITIMNADGTELPVDPVTGLAALNPWAKDSLDLESQKACMEKFPLLAEHLQRIAKGGGFTFKHAAETLDEQAKRAQLKSIDYGALHHATNVFREGGGQSITERNVAQSRFVKENPPEVVDFYKREAMPLRPFWSKAVRNLTKLSEVLSRDPNTGALLRRAQTIEDGWLQSELASAKEAESAARAAVERAERLSGAVRMS